MFSLEGLSFKRHENFFLICRATKNVLVIQHLYDYFKSTISISHIIKIYPLRPVVQNSCEGLSLSYRRAIQLRVVKAICQSPSCTTQSGIFCFHDTRKIAVFFSKPL